MDGNLYILDCADGSYYSVSTIDLNIRLQQHCDGIAVKHTKIRLPVKLVYLEKYPRLDYAFYREKQIQGRRREKKEGLIKGEFDQLPELVMACSDKFQVAEKEK